jgi:antitoxin VapB
MSLNIKNDEAHRLARELAASTGTSLTEAVTTALRRTLATEASVDESELLEAEVADRDTRTPDEILGYDPTGLPV